VLSPDTIWALIHLHQREPPSPFDREDVTIRYAPRDMGEIRVFYKDRFLCPAVSAELAGETIPLRDIIRVRDQRPLQLSLNKVGVSALQSPSVSPKNQFIQYAGMRLHFDGSRHR
jgi:Mu transposase, C-terminal